jgi:hypothetical protein
MWRVVFRVSFYRDTGSRLRNHLAPLFNAMGLHNTLTGTWESAAVALPEAAAQMARVLEALADPQTAVPGAGPQASLNHLWVYIDRV